MSPVSSPVRPDAATLVAVADALVELTGKADDADAARSRLHDIATRRGHRIDLLADYEPYDSTPMFDALIRQADGLTLSLSVCLPDELPWPLRGVVRASEQDVLRVNTTRLSVGEALASLDVVWQDTNLLQRVVDSAVIGDAVNREAIDVDERQLQQAADAFRRAKGLLTVADTQQWLAERQLSQQAFRGMIERLAKTVELRRRVTELHVEAWLAEHLPERDELIVAWFEKPANGGEFSPESATRLVAEALLAGRPAGIATWRVHDVPHLAGRLTAVSPGTFVDVELDARSVTAVVLARRPAVADDEARAWAARELFAAWLADQRNAADIEWFWGESARTGSMQ